MDNFLGHLPAKVYIFTLSAEGQFRWATVQLEEGTPHAIRTLNPSIVEEEHLKRITHLWK